MEHRRYITDLIDTWPRRKDFADEIGANVDAVHKWAAKNRIPSDWQAEAVAAAQRAGLAYVNGDWMVRAHARPTGNDLSQTLNSKSTAPANSEASCSE